MRRRRFRRELAQFLQDEKVAALIEAGRGDFGTMIVQASRSQKPEEQQGVPAVTMEAEHYDRVARLLDAGRDVELELDFKTTFYDHATIEAVRILEAIGIARRTIRIALWSGEEQGLPEGPKTARSTAVDAHGENAARADARPREAVRVLQPR